MKKERKTRKEKVFTKTFGALLCSVIMIGFFGQVDTVRAAIRDVYATGYYCVYNSEMEGTQTITKIISDETYILKASFLFGGWSVAMQGTGRTGPDGDYIHYISGGGGWAHIDNPEEFTDEVEQRYTNLGITDFTGFGNSALTHPDQAAYSRVSSITGASGRTLIPWYSIAVDPSVIPLGETGKLSFKSGTTPNGAIQMNFRADDTGRGIVGKHIDIYVGEGESSRDEWDQTGGNRYVDVYLGSGTQEDPYIITDVNALQAMNYHRSSWFELGNDIDASATKTWNEDPENPGTYFGFLPIGNEVGKFTGHFDGKEHTITDLFINRTMILTYTPWPGLFGCTDTESEIKNVGLIDVDITGEDYVGSLVGGNDGGVIDNCYSSGSVLGTGGISGGYSVGGLVGENYGGTITNCYSAASVNGGVGYEPNNYGNNIGGLVGVNHYQGTITNCYSTGNVIGGYGLGGLVGFNYSGTITNCYSTASVSGLGGPGVFPRRIGGLVGCHHQGTISNCYSTGNVSGIGTGIGGFIGLNEATCTDCFWDIETSGRTTSAGGTGKTTAQMKQQATFTNWDFVNIWDIDEGLTYPFLIYFNEISIITHSPVDLIVTDPDGLEISKELNEIPGATYLEYDLNGDGKLDDIVTVPKKIGDYLTQVVPEPNALPTDTYSLEVTVYDQTMVVAKDVQIQDIPAQPYEFESKLRYSDFDDDGDVDFNDLSTLCLHWLEQDCSYPAWCEGTDLDYSGRVNFVDFAIFAKNWLEGTAP